MKSNNPTSCVASQLKKIVYLLIIPLIATLTGCASAIDYALLSKQSYEQNQFDEAIISANQAIEKDPNNSYSWLWLGMSQLKKSQFQQAINSLSKAGKLNSDINQQKSITYHIAYAYYRISDCDNAITFYNQNIALGPDWMAYLHRSYCHMDKGMFDEALSDARHALQYIESNNDNFKIQAYRVITFAQLGLGNTEKSYNSIKRLKEKFPAYDTWEDLLAIADLSDDTQGMTDLLRGRGWLGLESNDYFRDDTQGAELDSFLYNNPNTQSELLPGDIIISLNNNPITNSAEFSENIKHQKPGYPVLVKALRLKKISQQEETDIHPVEEFASDFKQLEINIPVKSVPFSATLDILKLHPYHSFIQEKRNHYKLAEDALNNKQHKKAFELYMTSSRHWLDSDIINKVIELYWNTDKQIAPSEQAKKDLYFANKTKSQINNIADLNKTIEMYRKIIQDTPWWAEIHSTLATLYEQRQDYQLAANSLKHYLNSAIEDKVEIISGESKAAAIQKKIFNLEYKALSM